ncbi:hypothetical protein IMSHALPRED_007093 [Imshaugia aleurites]|uniref:Uncharacterized protein n=1 Tax=Imshaugia aleurites TaxID=172621 RepID=A0A8H3ITD9_9LECA|nr:hypothetical protein IMSHALPRED_007093 [Imshaugia aleurites]
MLVTKSVVFGLMSLAYTVSATKVTGKPILAKRQAAVTVTNGDCTAICDAVTSDCDVWCQEMGSTALITTISATSTSMSTVTPTVTPMVTATVTTTNSQCTEVCDLDVLEGEIDCSFECDIGFSTTMPSIPESTSSTRAALNQRTVFSTVHDDCTAVCWNLMPGTECDVQCSGDFKTKMPVPTKAAIVISLEARENVQAQKVREARLARKFGGLAARDDTINVTVTSIAELSQASAAAVSALSEALAFLSSVAKAGPISANATAARAALTGSVPLVTATTTTTTTPSETTNASTTTIESASAASGAGIVTTIPFSATGTAPGYTFSTGLVLFLLVALAANVAFLI